VTLAAVWRRVVDRLPARLQPHGRRVESSPLGRRLAKGTFWGLAGAGVSRGLALLASILVARMLGREGFGELGIIQGSVAMFGTFAGFGLGLTATKYVAEFREADPARAGRIVGLSSVFSWVTGGVVTLVLVLLAPWLAARTLNAPHLAGPLMLSAPLLALGAWAGAQTGVLTGVEAFRRLARLSLAVGLLNFPLMVGGVLLGRLPGAICGMVASALVGCLLNRRALRIETRGAGVPVIYAGCAREWPVLWKFSLPTLLAGIMVGPVVWACNALLVNRPGGYSEMGIFNAANQWRAAIVFLPGTLGTVLLPVLANLHGAQDAARYRKALSYNVALNAGISLAIAGGVALLAGPIMRSYGAEFAHGTTALILLAVAAVLSATLSGIGQAIVSSGNMWWGFALNAIWGVVLLGSARALVHRGATGLALAWCIAYGVHLVTVGLYAWGFLLRRRPEPR
jgi:O-antigen/teichoic acid export membrane protein